MTAYTERFLPAFPALRQCKPVSHFAGFNRGLDSLLAERILGGWLKMNCQYCNYSVRDGFIVVDRELMLKFGNWERVRLIGPWCFRFKKPMDQKKMAAYGRSSIYNHPISAQVTSVASDH